MEEEVEGMGGRVECRHERVVEVEEEEERPRAEDDHRGVRDTEEVMGGDGGEM